MEQWRAAIGSYNARKSQSLTCSFSSFQFLLALSMMHIVAAAFLQAMVTAKKLLILLTQTNPGQVMGKLHRLNSLRAAYWQLWFHTEEPGGR